MPVHLYGQPCDMGAIMKIAKKYNLRVIEDCAEAHGAMYNGKKVGSFGDIGCFSFYGNKVITTGEGGMCTTNDSKLYEKIRILCNHGMSKEKRYWHDVVGFNYRMTNLQAAIGVAQLERIEDIHKNRREYENCYRKLFSKKNYTFQNDIDNRHRITWLVSFLIDKDVDRDEYIRKLKEKGIDVRPFFYCLSDMQIYKEYCRSSTLVAKKVASLGLNLPTYESLKSVSEVTKILTNV
jgi:perosamine synthetase